MTIVYSNGKQGSNHDLGYLKAVERKVEALQEAGEDEQAQALREQVEAAYSKHDGECGKLRDKVAEAGACFLCGEVLSYPVVFWRSAKGAGDIRLVLHEECAGKFALKFTRDVWELDAKREQGRITGEGGLADLDKMLG